MGGEREVRRLINQVKDLVFLHEGVTKWKNQCPPERNGAEMRILYNIGFSWDETKEILLSGGEVNDSPTTEELLEIIKEKIGVGKRGNLENER